MNAKHVNLYKKVKFTGVRRKSVFEDDLRLCLVEMFAICLLTYGLLSKYDQ